MFATRRQSDLSDAEMRVAALGPGRVRMAEKPNEKGEQDRVLRAEYERLLRQLDRKPTDLPQPSAVKGRVQCPVRPHSARSA
jgi:hypothetical protein